ncbi:hypothetical protein CJF30_00005215 [Rutstroemia sp. NJR-2017a BBW]|nr:hypothetical protein CJF30_00005215 [Rutstroemia sp. NJR-2017a BBW]
MPRKQRRQGPQAALSDGLPTRNQHNPRPKVRIQSIGEGCILWLPARNENESGKIICIRDSCCSGSELDNEGYNHPVLVLKIRQDGICSFAQAIGRVNKSQVTSKEQKNRNKRGRAIDRLPISHHSTTDLDETVVGALNLEEGNMNRQSYVKTKHIFDVHITQLRALSFSNKSKPSDTRLIRESYEHLAQRFGLQEYERWVPTKLLVQGFGGYKPAPPQVVPVQPRKNPPAVNRTISAPEPDSQLPLLYSSDIPTRQVRWQDSAWTDLEINARGTPPPDASTDSPPGVIGYALRVAGFAACIAVCYWAVKALL